MYPLCALTAVSTTSRLKLASLFALLRAGVHFVSERGAKKLFLLERCRKHTKLFKN